MATSRPIASVSLDLDDLWTYLRTRGDPSWEQRPSYLPVFIPQMLDVLDRLQTRITFFVVGFDATQDANVPHLRALSEHGHEVGNHSFRHETWMQLLPPDRLEAEIVQAEDALLTATGQKPIGFRGPGFTWSPALLEVLARHGYQYDGSTLPTFIGPLARLYLIGTARLTPEERAQRSALFGGFSDGFRPNKPYRWTLSGGRSLVEIPVTTMPVSRLPFHMSYLLYLSAYSPALMRAYAHGHSGVQAVCGAAQLPAASARPARRRPGAATVLLPRHESADGAEAAPHGRSAGDARIGVRAGHHGVTRVAAGAGRTRPAGTRDRGVTLDHEFTTQRPSGEGKDHADAS